MTISLLPEKRNPFMVIRYRQGALAINSKLLLLNLHTCAIIYYDRHIVYRLSLSTISLEKKDGSKEQQGLASSQHFCIFSRATAQHPTFWEFYKQDHATGVLEYYLSYETF